MAKFQTATLTFTFSKAVKDGANDKLPIEGFESLISQLEEVVGGLLEDKSIVVEVSVN